MEKYSFCEEVMQGSLWGRGTSIHFQCVPLSFKNASYALYKNENNALLKNTKNIDFVVVIQVANPSSYSVDK